MDYETQYESAPTFDEPASRSTWPTVVGVVSIVFGGLGVVGAIATPFTAGMAPPDANMPPPPEGAALFIQGAQNCLALILAVVLLTGGIGLLQRRGWSRPTLMGWSIAKLILVAIGIVVGFLGGGAAQIEQMNQQFADAGMDFAVSQGMVITATIVSAIWFAAWPIFLLIWFSRGTIKNEVDAWREADRAAV